MSVSLMVSAVLLVHAGAPAYIGPGLGAGLISVVLGLLASIFLAIVAVFWYPLKRFVRKLRGAGREGSGR